MKILIAVPTFENIYPDTFKAIYDIEKGNNEVLFEFVRGYDCETARNKIAQLGIDKHADYILMVDNDVVVPKDAIENFLDDPKDICLGCYPHRNASNEYRDEICLYHLGERDYVTKYSVEAVKELEEKGEYKFHVHGGGMGCAFIKTSLFNELDYPWFHYVNYKNRTFLSEDLYFCQKCNDHGIKIFADSRIHCGHILRKLQMIE